MVHIGIIPDGNRRWCKKNNYGLDTLCDKWVDIILTTINDNIQHFKSNKINKYKHLQEVDEISLYVCSIDNMNRNDGTKETIFNFIRKLVGIYKNKEKELDTKILNNIREHLQITKINIIGDMESLPEDIQELCIELSKEKENIQYTVNIAIAYDYQKDMINYGNNNITNYNREQSNIDILFRSGGEKRISGFFPTKVTYSELFFEKKLWPEITLDDLNRIVKLFKKRERRFGK